MSERPSEYVRSNELLSRSESRLLIVDVQEKLMPAISVADQLIRNCRRLIQGAKILGVPVSSTEQYPQGLGGTVAELASELDAPAAKVRFSCAECLSWGVAAQQPEERFKLVLAGIEAHVCVQQTALDFIAQGFRVHIPADAVASRHKLDWKMALARMADSGAILTTTESILFEWCEAAGTAEFKQISRLIRDA